MTPLPSPHPDIRNVREKLIIFREGGRGGGYPFAENSTKIINVIFEPSLKSMSKISSPDQDPS